VVRIRMIERSLRRIAFVETISGGRLARGAKLLRWLASGGPARIDGIYVESASSFATPIDVIALWAARLLGRGVGVYFRDAYQLFRDEYQVHGLRPRILDAMWHVSTWLLRKVATVRFVPSMGLGQALGFVDFALLPPGTDPEAPDLGPGATLDVAYVGATGTNDGLALLIQAMAFVTKEVPKARLVVICREGEAPPEPRPPWLEIRHGDRESLPILLNSVRVCVIPRPVTPYTSLAVPIKLMDYLSYGKPIVATDCEETARLLRDAEAGVIIQDDAIELAGAIRDVLIHDVLAERLSRAARTYALTSTSTWDSRAGLIIRLLHVSHAESSAPTQQANRQS
jgi:glycosyltransferase involved in cell wall biosynthesis